MDDLLAAEERLEEAWCALDAEWHRLLAEAAREADAIVDAAREEAAALLLEAQEHADRIVAEARARQPVATTADDPTGIREALQRLRAEVSNVVDAALDAFPAIEATADLFPAPSAPAPAAEPAAPAGAIDIDLTAADTHDELLPARPGRLRRLLRLPVAPRRSLARAGR
jgi:hypothetical protein